MFYEEGLRTLHNTHICRANPDQTLQNAVCDRGLNSLHTGISIKNKIENEKVHRYTRHPLNGKQTRPINPYLPNGLVHPYHLDVHFEF